jgi:HlyD family secretion protein
MASTRSQRQQEISRTLQDAQALGADLSERLRGARDLLAKRNVVAPEAGTVANIRAFTPGSAIGAGQPILDLVPDNERMVIEAKVRPDDIAQVAAGQHVNVRLTAFKARQVPVLGGTLVYVSADRQEDAQGNAFFMVRAELDPASLAHLPDVRLEPGMPAEVLIIGGERLAIDYLISPITDSLHRAMRER